MMMIKQMAIALLFLCSLNRPMTGQAIQRLSQIMGVEISKIGFVDASEFGFSQKASGLENQKALQAAPDGTIYHSVTQPVHTTGNQMIDGINWGVAQDKVVYSVGVRNVVYRDIFLEKPRTAFSVNFNMDKYCRSYYPGAEIPVQENISSDNIRLAHNQPVDWLQVTSPVDALTIINSGFKNSSIGFEGVESVPDYKRTRIDILGCTFGYPGKMNLLTNKVNGKEIMLKMSSNMALDDHFSAIIGQGKGKNTVESDLKIEEDPQGKK